MPFENTSRCPRLVSCFGMKLSPAWNDAKPGEVGERRVRREHQDQHRRPPAARRRARCRRRCPRTPACRPARSPSGTRTRTAPGGPSRRGTRARGTASPRTQPMMTSVRRALSHSGFLNAVTPFEIASTPVTAVPLTANAWSIDGRAGAVEDARRPRCPASCARASRWRAGWSSSRSPVSFAMPDHEHQRPSSR